MYVPPEVGYCAASWADEDALVQATTAAISRPISRPAPPAAAAGANAAKIPAPIIEPSPMTTASKRPSLRSRAGLVGVIAATCLTIGKHFICEFPDGVATFGKGKLPGRGCAVDAQYSPADNMFLGHE